MGAIVAAKTHPLDRSRLDRLIERARHYEAACRAPATRRARAQHWRAWHAWCERMNLSPLPADPAALALWLIDELDRGRAIGTLAQRLVAVTAEHRDAGLPSPLGDPQLRDIWQGLRRQHGVAPIHVKAPLLTEDLRQLLDTCDPDTPVGARDRALLLVGFAGAFRRAELVGLDVTDCRIGPRGLDLRLRRSKTDPLGRGETVTILRGRQPETCPVAALDHYLAQARRRHGPLFRRALKNGRLADTRLSAQSVALIVKRAARAAGLDPTAYAGHSLRAGFATQAARGGAPERTIMRQTRHRKVEMVRRYIREGDRFRDNASGHLNL